MKNRHVIHCYASRVFLTGTALTCFAALGCDGGASETDSAPPVPTVGSADDSKTRESSGQDENFSSGSSSERKQYTGISFEIPSAWNELPDQQMVDSKYIVPHEKGDMELTLTSMGGGLDANLQRWVGQVQLEPGDAPDWSKLDVAGIESSVVDARGGFHTRVGDNPGQKEDWRLVGIAVPLPRDFFVKLVGPREAIAEYYEELKDFLKTAKVD